MLIFHYVCWCYCLFILVWFIFFFFKQKTAYEMRISDWSSDVCSSDLRRSHSENRGRQRDFVRRGSEPARSSRYTCGQPHHPSRQIGRASCRERVCQYV